VRQVCLRDSACNREKDKAMLTALYTFVFGRVSERAHATEGKKERKSEREQERAREKE